MPLYCNVRRKSPNPSGKFYRMARSGVERGTDASYHGWTYHLVRHATGTTVRRTIYHVSIVDPLGLQASYLTNFPSANKAIAAARSRIDELWARATAI